MKSEYYIPEDDRMLLPGQYPIPDPAFPPREMVGSKAFMDWFKDSEIKTPSGDPLMVFHGTSRENRAFKSSRHVDMEGAYFTPSFLEAKQHAYMDGEIEGEQPYVIAVFLCIKKPYYSTGFESHTITTEQKNALVAAGYDGIIDRNEETGIVGEYVVFETHQIAPFHGGVIEIPEPPIAIKHKSRRLDESPSP